MGTSDYQKTCRKDQPKKPAKIEWIINTADGYDSAVEAGKPIVMVFGENGQWSKAMDKELDKEEFQNYQTSCVLEEHSFH